MCPGSPLEAYPGSPAVVAPYNSHMPEDGKRLRASFCGKTLSGLATPVWKM